jgi:Tfp pilus assembly protein PilX
MNLKHKQRGSTLAIALIMLVVLTLLVVSAIRSSNTNLRIAGNMQTQAEAAAASQQVIEQIISYDFAASPAATTVNVDINNDGTADYTVASPTPTCLGSTPLDLSTLTAAQYAAYAQCGTGGSTTTPAIIYASSVSATGISTLCYKQKWEVQATATNTSTGGTTTVHQGVSMNVPVEGTGC